MIVRAGIGAALFVLAGCASQGTPPIARVPLPSLFSNEDYPVAALRYDQQGTVGVTLDVGVDGRVTGCTVAISSGHPALDASTCRLLRNRARFAPATDARGTAIAGTTAARIRWALPPAPPSPPPATR